MHKLALAASAVALASVMAISTGPASAQSRIYGDVPYDGPTWGMMNPPGNNYVDAVRYVNYFGGGAATDDHAARCEARYRSYDAATNSFLGYDGLVHQCAL